MILSDKLSGHYTLARKEASRDGFLIDHYFQSDELFAQYQLNGQSHTIRVKRTPDGLSHEVIVFNLAQFGDREIQSRPDANKGLKSSAFAFCRSALLTLAK